MNTAENYPRDWETTFTWAQILLSILLQPPALGTLCPEQLIFLFPLFCHFLRGVLQIHRIHYCLLAVPVPKSQQIKGFLVFSSCLFVVYERPRRHEGEMRMWLRNPCSQATCFLHNLICTQAIKSELSEPSGKAEMEGLREGSNTSLWCL